MYETRLPKMFCNYEPRGRRNSGKPKFKMEGN